MRTLIELLCREYGALQHAMRCGARAWAEYRYLRGGWRNPDELPF